MTKRIATAYVEFTQSKGGKRHPIFIIDNSKNSLLFFDITSKYRKKSNYIRQWYFQINDYHFAGLHKPSWIDTFRVYSLAKNSCRITYIGNLSDNDTSRLRRFLKQTHH